jgi:hypothetical protein
VNIDHIGGEFARDMDHRSGAPSRSSVVLESKRNGGNRNEEIEVVIDETRQIESIVVET